MRFWWEPRPAFTLVYTRFRRRPGVFFVFIGRAVSITRGPYGFSQPFYMRALHRRGVGPPSVPYTEVFIVLTTFSACSPMMLV